MFSFGDEEPDLGASERVGAQVVGRSGCGAGGLPEATNPVGVSDRPASGGGEDRVVLVGLFEPGGVSSEVGGDGPREGNVTDALGGLGRSDDTVAAPVSDAASDAKVAAFGIEVATLEPGDFVDPVSIPGAATPPTPRSPGRGRYWDRTSDLCRVKAALSR